MNDQRMLMLRALLLDWLGQVLIAVSIPSLCGWFRLYQCGDSLHAQFFWFVFVLLLYPFLGWLFGSYTVLRWRRLSFFQSCFSVCL